MTFSRHSFIAIIAVAFLVGACDDPNEVLCSTAHRANLLNPETLKVSDFRRISKEKSEEWAKEEQQGLELLLAVSNLQCQRAALPATLAGDLLQSCVRSKVGLDSSKYIAVLRAVIAQGDAAKVYTFRAKANSRDGRQITHMGVCVIDASGKAIAAQSD